MDCLFVQMLGPCSTGTVLHALYASHYSFVVCRTLQWFANLSYVRFSLCLWCL